MVVGGHTFFDAIPTEVMAMILIGSVLYLLGVIFYLWKKYRYNHAVWHVFVLAAAVCPYLAILMAV